MKKQSQLPKFKQSPMSQTAAPDVVVEIDGIKLEPVESTNLAKIGYDEARQILAAQFKTGSIYKYEDVPVSVYDGLMAASSKGGYFNAMIAKSFKYQRVQ